MSNRNTIYILTSTLLFTRPETISKILNMNPFRFASSHFYLICLLKLFSLTLLLTVAEPSRLQDLLNSSTQHRSQLSDLTFIPVEQSSKNYKDSESTDFAYNYQAYDYDNSSSVAPSNDLESPDYDQMDLSKPKRLVANTTMSSPEKLKNEIDEMHEVARYHFIEQFKEKMLSKLRLLAPPNMNDIPKHRYPAHVVDALEQSSEFGYQKDEPVREVQDNYHAKIKTTLRFAEPLPNGKIHPKNLIKPSKKTLYFKLPRNIDENNVDKSTLFVYPRWPSSSNFTNLQLVVKSNYRPDKPVEKRKLSYTPTATTVHWQHIVITKLVQEWVESDDETNLGIIIEFLDENDNIIYQEEPVQDHEDNSERVSFIKLQLNDQKPTRRRNIRSTDQMNRVCELSDQEERCCRYRFVLDFDELGPDFDFIITPRRFTANYCAGQCPNFYLPSSANSHLTAGLTRGKQSRCCTATELEPLNMVYVNRDGSINSGDLPGMSIARCGCD